MNLNFRKGIFLTLSLFSSQVLAISAHDCLYCNRFYVGGMLGAASLVDRESTSNPTRNAHSLSAMGPIGGAILGFDFCLLEQVRLELEGFFNVNSISVSDNQDYAPQTSYIDKMRYNTGIRLLPTYEFTPQTAGHLILGYSYTKFRISDNGNYGIINQMFGQNGMQIGLGVETFLAKWVLLRGDVIYTGYQAHSSDGVTTIAPSSIQVYTNNFSTLEADMAIIYKI